MKFTASQRSRSAGFDMMPMVDVVLQLIIFFMYTMKISQMVRSEIELPEQPGEQVVVQEAERIVVDVQADGTLYVDSQPIGYEQLMARVRAEAVLARAGARNAGQVAGSGGVGGVHVLVRAHRDAPMSVMNRLGAGLNRAGVDAWQIGTASTHRGEDV